MLLGVDYYPEQWDENLMDEDMDRILELGSNVIRIGEFAWHLMEKYEGGYDFSFFDKVIEKAKSKGLKVIFGTPTATMPAWLAKKYPEVLSQFPNGTKRTFGGRHVYCFSSHIYKMYCEKIVTELALHYKDEKAIVAWQIDNELGHEGSDVCWCENCRKAFNSYLETKFKGDIDSLNETYGTAFWSQEYNSFDEIPLPAPTITTHNPALRLDFERFCSDNIESFAEMQGEIIKSIIPDAVIMHDFPGGGLGKHVDYSKVSSHLDKVAFNNYPVWGGQKYPIAPNEIAFGLDYIRGLKGENFWITEAIMGAQGHDITGFLPRPNQAKMWSWQGMARGCDSLMYFRYRGATKGAEQFCYGILDADNVKRRRFYEVQNFFTEAKKYEDVLSSPVKSDICIVYDYDSLASFRIQQQSILLDCENEMKRYHKLFYDVNKMVDVIPASRDFSQYKIVIVPHMIVGKGDFLTRLKEYAENGGCVIMTYRTAIKDENNNLTFGKVIPVDCCDLAGAYIEETESVQEYDCIPLAGEGENKGKTGTAGIFRDMLVPESAETLYRYDDDFYKGFSAVTRNAFGKGRVYYMGTTPDESILKEIAKDAMDFTGIEATESPDGIEVVERESQSRKVKIIMNHNYTEASYNGVTLAPFEVKVI